MNVGKRLLGWYVCDKIKNRQDSLCQCHMSMLGSFVLDTCRNDEHVIDNYSQHSSILTSLTTAQHIPVCTPCLRNTFDRLCTLSKELKWCTDWCKPYMPFWCWGKPVSNADLAHSHHNYHIIYKQTIYLWFSYNYQYFYAYIYLLFMK